VDFRAHKDLQVQLDHPDFPVSRDSRATLASLAESEFRDLLDILVQQVALGPRVLQDFED
jgi:hypothetical protein